MTCRRTPRLADKGRETPQSSCRTHPKIWRRTQAMTNPLSDRSSLNYPIASCAPSPARVWPPPPNRLTLGIDLRDTCFPPTMIVTTTGAIKVHTDRVTTARPIQTTATKSVTRREPLPIPLVAFGTRRRVVRCALRSYAVTPCLAPNFFRHHFGDSVFPSGRSQLRDRHWTGTLSFAPRCSCLNWTYKGASLESMSRHHTRTYSRSSTCRARAVICLDNFRRPISTKRSRWPEPVVHQRFLR